MTHSFYRLKASSCLRPKMHFIDTSDLRQAKGGEARQAEKRKASF
jgi:hypothetical protein